MGWALYQEKELAKPTVVGVINGCLDRLGGQSSESCSKTPGPWMSLGVGMPVL